MEETPKVRYVSVCVFVLMCLGILNCQDKQQMFVNTLSTPGVSNLRPHGSSTNGTLAISVQERFFGHGIFHSHWQEQSLLFTVV